MEGVEPSSEQFRTRDGRRIAYRDSGGSADALTLICHPGGPGMSGRYLMDLTPACARTVHLDPRGTGNSDPPADGRYDLGAHAADVDLLVSELGLRRVVLLGHSFGGFVTLTRAAEPAPWLAGLILVCTQAQLPEALDEEQAAADQRHVGADWLAGAITARTRRQAGGPWSGEQLREFHVAESPLWFDTDAGHARFLDLTAGEVPNGEVPHAFSAHEASDYDLRPALKEITVPTLIITGRRDYFGPRTAERDLGAIPASRCVSFHTSGHFPFLDEPDRFETVVCEFLGSLG